MAVFCFHTACVFGRIGGFNGYTLGYGLVMNGYSNMLRYPQERKIGLQVGGMLPYKSFTIEAFTANLTTNDILAGRVTAVPLEESGIPYLQRIRLGATIATDLNQYNGLIDSDNDGYANVFDDFPFDSNWHNEVDYNVEYWREVYTEIVEHNGVAYNDSLFNEWFYGEEFIIERSRNRSISALGDDAVAVFGLDYALPLIESKALSLTHYGELAKIADHNMGFIFPGFWAQFMIFDANLEFRYYQDDFEPAFFNNLYDENRVYVVETADTAYVVTKEEAIAFNNQQRGWYGSVITNIFNTLFLKIAYEDMYGRDVENGKSLWGSVWLEQKLIPKLSVARLDYSQTRVKSILSDWRTPSSMIEGRLGYALSPNTSLVGKYQERYVDLNGNGKIGGEEETIKAMTFGVEFSF